jgi:DNA topoisomerase-1
MPTPKPGEKEEDYIPRCVREVMGEGSTQQQALGKCYGMFREHQHKVAECHAQAIRDETLAQADKLGIQNPEHWAANAQKMVMVEHTQAVRKELIETTKKLVDAVGKTTDYRSDEGKMVDEAYKIEKGFKEDDHPREDDGKFKGDGNGAGEGGRQSGGGVHSEDHRGAERRPLGYGGSEGDRAYTREDIAGGKASRASLEVAKSFEREHKLAAGAVVAVHHQANGARHYELSGEKGAEFYHKTLDDLRSRNPAGAQVSLKLVSDYKSMRLFVDDGANAACALDGQDIVSACSNPGKGKPSAFPGMLQSMIDEGGKTGDCYGTFLPAYYARFGLEMQARLPWNQEVWDDYAAEERKSGRLSEDQLDNQKVFADFGGKPDYYLFAHTGNTKLRPADDVPVFDDWDKAAEERDKALTKKKIEKAATSLATLAVNKALDVFGVTKGGARVGAVHERKDGPYRKVAQPSEWEKDASGKPTAVNAKMIPRQKVLPKFLEHTAIPPAWKNVQIAKSEKEPLWAMGVDKKARTQKIYNPRFKMATAKYKYDKVKKMQKVMASYTKENDKNAKSGSNEAECLSLIISTGIRPGGEKDTSADVEAYGATQLEGRHVVELKNGVRLRFTGKKGVSLDIPVDDPKVAKMLLRRKAQAGSKGRIFDTTGNKLALYSKSLGGNAGIRPKDLRTHLANKLAREYIEDIKAPTDESSYKEATKAIAARVGEKLGNSATVCLQSYINPDLFDEWKESAGL